MVKIGPGYIWQRGNIPFIGEFYLDRGEEAFEFSESTPCSALHQRRDIILTRMLEW